MPKMLLPSNCEIEDLEDGTFRMLFHSAIHRPYVSEIYGVDTSQSLLTSAYAVCQRFGWIENPPNSPEND